MLLHIATVVSWSILSVTAIEFQRQSAISSQSFHRDDAPLSYKFSAIHEYSSPKSVVKENHEPHLYDRDPLDPGSPKIQYAPLTGLYAKYYGAKGPKGQELYLKKDHLEPRPHQGHRIPMPEGHVHSTAQALQAHGDVYVPGHNIEVLQNVPAVTRFPAHNAVYLGYKEDPQDQNRQHLESSTPRMMSAIEAINRYAMDNADNRQPEKQKLVLYNLAPYTKKHSLFLNVARTYNFEPKSQEVQAQLRDPLLQVREPTLVQIRDPTLMVQVKNPEILRNPNTHSVIFSQKIKETPCYGCGVEYNVYKH